MSQDDPSRLGRRAADRTAGAEAARAPASMSSSTGPAADLAFETQMLTQGTVKRGLRGGKEVLEAARSTYLKTEWSGPADRRPREGLFTKTKI